MIAGTPDTQKRKIIFGTDEELIFTAVEIGVRKGQDDGFGFKVFKTEEGFPKELLGLEVDLRETVYLRRLSIWYKGEIALLASLRCRDEGWRIIETTKTRMSPAWEVAFAKTAFYLAFGKPSGAKRA